MNVSDDGKDVILYKVVRGRPSWYMVTLNRDLIKWGKKPCGYLRGESGAEENSKYNYLQVGACLGWQEDSKEPSKGENRK